VHAAPFAFCLLIVGLAPGCEAPEKHLALKEGLQAARDAAARRPLSAEELSDLAGVQRAMGRPARRALAGMGARTLRFAGRYALSQGGAQELQLREAVHLQVDADGDFWVSDSATGGPAGAPERTRGRRCGWVEGHYYSGRAHGPMSRVPIQADEHDRCLRSGFEPMTGLVELFAGELAVAAVEPGTLMGRPTLRVRLERATEVFQPPAPLPLAWPPRTRGEARPDSPAIFGPRDWLVRTHARAAVLQGEVVFDVKSGLVVAGALEGRFGVRKADRSANLEISVELGSTSLSEPLRPPADVQAYGPRPRLMADREALLGRSKPAAPVALPKPGDAPPLRVGPDEETPAGPPEDPDDEDRPKPVQRKRP
jgi:hypothetical protein